MSLGSPDDWQLGSAEIGTVCVKILEESLLREGDFIYFWENASISLNGIPVADDPSHIPEDEEVIISDENTIVATTEYDFDEDGTVDEVGLEYKAIASGVYSDTLCWTTDLTPGSYEVELLVWTSTDDRYAYSWEFEVTP